MNGGTSEISNLTWDPVIYIIKKNLIMCFKRITPDAALQGYNLKILKQLMYKTKHGNLNKTELQTLQRKINGKLKLALKLVRTVPDDVFFGHGISGGLETPHERA